MTGKVKVIFNSKEGPLECEGQVSVSDSNTEQPYISWQISDANQTVIAFYAKKVFTMVKENTKNELLDIVTQNIENYRIGRKRVFKVIDIELVNS